MPVNITEEFVRYLMEQNASLSDQVAELTATVKELNQTIKELKEQLNKNSKNSSKPPSSDGLKKPAVNKNKSLRESSRKKQGAQEGHDGVHLSVISEPDHIEDHMHSDCTGCPHRAKCFSKACIKETRHEVDAVVTVDVTAHNLIEVRECLLHGGVKTGSFPENIKATVQYGKNLQAMVVAFNTVGAVSINRTHEILSSVFNIPLATGTIKNMVTRCAESLKDTYERIRLKMIMLGLIHCDETGSRVDGKTCWGSYWKYQDEVSYYHRHKFDMEYDAIIKTAYEENPLPETPAKKRGRKKKSKVLNLICRLDNYKESVCLFIKNLCVPFDNNQAERNLRMVKVKTKVSGCFRSEEGAQEYLTIMSYIGSARKHGINAFTAIREALNGNPDIIFS